MLRLAAVRSTRRYAPATVRWSRFGSTVPTTNSSSSEAASKPAAKPNLPVVKQGKKPATTKAKAKKEIAVAPSEKTWQELGLKYDPETLPIEQTLDPNLAPFTEEDYAMTLIHGRSVHKPFFHPRTHDIPVANIHFRSHHVKHLNLFTHFASHAATALGIPASEVIALPTQRRLWTVLRSPFAHKKSQENFERKVHKRAIKAWDADPEVVQRWIAYLRTHAMPGVGMKVITWERMPLGVGAKTQAVGHTETSAKKIEELGKKIVVEETIAQQGSQLQVKA
ncbi:ribosomal protein S10 [Pholiota conissans]|uniref:Small ribosomal subunit protein uS10m n=1 Tax=Pholiota conissans TaxID=109636 RepID=A0A9P6CPC5_9AGAR|nr:ribosomal protein S10 [Pholiota conissans]